MAYNTHARMMPYGVVLSPAGQETPPRGGRQEHGKPRAGEDEPESTLDNDEKVEKTSHPDHGHDNACNNGQTPQPGHKTGPHGHATP
ncbi:hypothetical protein [Komagataeibacter sp. FNDCF1]|uniref:hypothetical protein n=1 Tax=Komagataeibacter sp. FNDCF1 TaxID=2878681 RepID=UPI001E392C70|nr:hypothetical protein [Komagataeibacter sp. FNDCF1]MCE2563223.1 hypothetical protein [Komagataeibacter sp. FNDCF1]